MEIPETRYAKTSDGVSIAHQIIGDGAIDLVYVPGFASNLEYNWENPRYARFLRRLGSFSRLIVLDRRGTGLSDRMSPEDLPPIEVLVEDLRGVLDDADGDRAAFFGFSDGADLCVVFAAAHPDRTTALVLHGTTAVGTGTPDLPWAWTEEQWSEHLDGIRVGWGTRAYSEELLKWVAPTAFADEHLRR